MKCKKCKAKIDKDTLYCSICGQKIEKNSSKKKGLICLFISIVFLGILISATVIYKNISKAKMYNDAIEAFENKKYLTAKLLFEELKDYKESEKMYLESCKLYNIQMDKKAPIISNVPKDLEMMIGTDFDLQKWIMSKNIMVEDDITEECELKIDTSKVDLNTVGEYEVTITAKDEAGNMEEDKFAVYIKDYLVHEAYLKAINISTDKLDMKGNGSAEYEGIHISQDEIYNLEDGSIYRSIAKQLEGFYILGEKYYGNWGEDVTKLIFGKPKEPNWEQMELLIEKASLLISRRTPLGYILYRIDQSNSSEGTFDYDKGYFNFKVKDLTALAQDLEITEEMLGYILACMEEYGPDTNFEENTYTLEMTCVGERNCNIDDYTTYLRYEEKNSEMEKLNEIGEQAYIYYYSYDREDFNENINDRIYGINTYKGIQLLHSKEAVIFVHGGGKITKYNKNQDEIYNDMVTKNKKECRILEQCCEQIKYTLDGVGNVIYYFDDSNQLIFLMFTNFII